MVFGNLFRGLGGAASGAAAGSAFGPIGTGIGAVVGGLGSLGGSSSGGGGAGNMGGMTKAYIPEPIASRYAGSSDPAKFLEAFRNNAFKSKSPGWAEEEINRMLTPAQRSDLLAENKDFQNIVGFEYDPTKRRELASVFGKGALGGKAPTSDFLDRLVDTTKELGINDPFGMQRAAEQAAAFDPRAPKIASKQQREMEAMYGQFNPENSKYLVGYPMQGLIDRRIASA